MSHCNVLRQLAVICVCVVTAASLPCFGQTDRATIEGFVTDTSGAAVASAHIGILRLETNDLIELSTNELGRYFAPNLPLGTYRVEVEKQGFRKMKREPIYLQSQSNVRADFRLEVGAVTESVNVTSEAPMVDASTATLTTGLTTKFIDDLPLITIGRKRDITQFLRYLPGVTRDSTWGARVNGSNPGNSEVFLDGAPASQGNVRGGIQENGPAVEHVGEFSITTNAFNAEYGRTGSWFTNITIRSGTNQLHGSVFDYFANDALNARSFFQPRPTVIRQNEGGATLGGPVYLPKVYDGRNKTFFFFGQQLFFNRQVALGNLLTIPRADFRDGDFSNLRDASGAVIPIFDPATTRPDGAGGYVRDPFPDNRIPSNRISAASRQMVALMPQPNIAGRQTENWYNRTGTSPKFDTYISTLKMDHSFSTKQKISVTYSDQNRPQIINGRGWGVDSPLEGLQSPKFIHDRTGRINYDWIVQPTLLSHFTFGMDRYNNKTQTSTVGGGWNQKLGITGLPWDAGAFPYVSFTGGTASPIALSNLDYSQTANGRVTFNENLTWIKGRHSMKFGMAYYREYQNSFEGRDGSGNFTFSNTTTSQPNAGPNFSRWGNSFASFLLGDVFQTQTRSPITLGWRFRYWAMFVQDEWRMTPRLTLSYGLRWELYPAPWEVHDRASSFNPDAPNPAAGGLKGALIFAGAGPGRIGSRTLYDGWYKGLAPRLGVAYQATPKTVLRASGGIYYAPSMRPRLTSYGFVTLPVFNSPDGYTPVYNWADPFPQNFPRAPFIDPAFQNDQTVSSELRDSARAPQTLSWTFSIQRELAQNLALDVSYIGSHSTHLIMQRDLSNMNVVDPRYLPLGPLLLQPITSQSARDAGIRSPFPGFENQRNNTVAQALKPYPQYVNVQEEYGPRGIARYNSLQIKLTKRFSSGIQFLTFYTWAKNMTNVEGGTIDFSPGDGAVQNPLNRAGEVAVSIDGPPHIWVGSASYDLPFGPGKPWLNRGGLVGRIVGGWQLVGYVRRASGLPLAMTVGNNLAPLGYPNKRANYVAGQLIHMDANPREYNPAVNRFLNPNAFAIPGLYELGNTARVLDWARGWTQKSESVSIGKRIQMFERLRAVLRADVDNPFNFVRWADPVTNRSDANFGRVIDTQPGRTMQLSLSIEF